MPPPEAGPAAIAIRAERDGDRVAIFAAHAAACPADAEARLVDAIGAAGTARASLVADVGGAIAGHVAFSPVAVESAPRRNSRPSPRGKIAR